VEFGSGRRAYFQVTRGKISIGGVELGEGDGARVSAEERVNLSAAADSEVLLFDLP
jgi:redox-sensitive bicupin YhaK (pirin superfamily)